MSKLKPIEHKFKALFFHLLKGTLKKKSAPTGPLDVSKIKRVIFFRQDRLGDMVVTLPIIDGLKKSFPHIDVSILASPKNLPLIENDPRFEKIYLYTKNWREIFREIRKIKASKFDVIVDTLFGDSVTGLFLSQYCANGRPTVCLGKSKYERYYNYNFENESNHLIDNMLKILNAFGVDESKISGYGGLYLDEKHLATADEFLNSFPVNSDIDSTVGVNLSSGAPNRIWQDEKWIELISKIQSHKSDCRIALFTVPSERDKAESVKSRFNDNVQIIPEKLDILGVSAIIKKLSILVSPDTSLIHIARAFGIPVVALYSGQFKNFSLWHPYQMKHGAVRANANDDIFDITTQQVFEKFLEMTDVKQEVSQ